MTFSHGKKKNTHAFSEKNNRFKTACALSPPALPQSLRWTSEISGDSSNLTRRERSTTKNTRQTSFQIKPKKKSDRNKCPTKTSIKPKLAFVLFVVGIFLFLGLKIRLKTPPKTGGFLFVFFNISRMKNLRVWWSFWTNTARCTKKSWYEIGE